MNAISFRISTVFIAIILMLSVVQIRAVAAQEVPPANWPSSQIVIVVPWPAGGPIDSAFRPVAEKLSDLLKQPVVIENRGGANGTIGSRRVANATPDGYTLLAASPGPVLIAPLAEGDMNYNVLDHFSPITQIASSPSVFVVRADLNIKSLAELIAYAKANPGKLNYASVGIGSIADLQAVALAERAGIKFERIPYQGAAPLMTDLLTGRTDFTAVSAGPVLAHIRSGKLIAIGVTSEKPARVLPDVPPINDSLPGYVSDNWYGVLAPTGTPKPIRDRLHAAFVKAMADKQMTAKLIANGTDPFVSDSPDAFAKMMLEDTKTWISAIKAAGFTIKR